MHERGYLAGHLLLAVVLAAFFAAGSSPAQPALPIQGGPLPPTADCKAILLPFSDGGGCVGGYVDCTDALGNVGDPCCTHFHYPLTWSESRQWIAPTGNQRGPTFKKFYTSRDDLCAGTTCVQGVSTIDLQHFKRQGTLVACSQR